LQWFKNPHHSCALLHWDIDRTGKVAAGTFAIGRHRMAGAVIQTEPLRANEILLGNHR
jgi:hypothetical protein